MIVIPKFPKKVQYLLSFSFPVIKKLCEKSEAEKFVGGRPGYDKEMAFFWLLMKKVTNWSFRTIGEIAGVSHSTLVRTNSFFLKEHVYEKFFAHLVKQAYRKGLIHGTYVAMDSLLEHFPKNKKLVQRPGMSLKKDMNSNQALSVYKKDENYFFAFFISKNPRIPVGMRSRSGSISGPVGGLIFTFNGA